LSCCEHSLTGRTARATIIRFGIAAQVGEIGGIIERLIILPEVMHCDAAAVLVVEISYHVLYQRT
jgi:hypothetical protein